MRVIIFGDSFSCDFNKINYDYVIWKGYEPNNFGKIISEELNIEYLNFANGGWDNYTIFHSIFLFFKNNNIIYDDDIIIIGWTHISRYRIPSLYDYWIPITPHTIINFNKKNKPTNISNESLLDFYNNRISDLYYEEINDFIECIKKIFNKNIIINWTWVKDNKINTTLPFFNYHTIYDETDGVINDLHLNEESSKYIANEMLKYIKNNL